MSSDINPAPVSEALMAIDLGRLTTMPVADLLDQHTHINAVQEFLRHRHSQFDLQNQAAEYRLRIERQLGTHLKTTVVPRGHHGGVKGSAKSLPDGITKKQSHQWQREADVPDEAFEQWIRETRQAGNELTTAGLLRLWTVLNTKRPKHFPNGSQPARTTYACPRCHYEWSGKPKPGVTP